MNPQPPLNPNQKQRAADKLSRIPVKIENTEPALKKPDWIRIKLPSNEKIVELIDEALQKPEDQKHLKAVKRKVNAFMKKFPLYS